MRGLRSQRVIYAFSAIVLLISIFVVSAQDEDDASEEDSTEISINGTIQGRNFNWYFCPKKPRLLRHSGTFMSPYYDGVRHYPNDVRCIWKLKTKKRMVLQIEVTAFDIEGSPPCLGDSFSVIYGKRRRSAPQVVLCGSKPSFVFTTCTQTAFVIFMSDDRGGKTGFKASFKSVPMSGTSCSGGSQVGIPTPNPAPPPTPSPTTPTPSPTTPTPSPTTPTPSPTTPTPSPTTPTPSPTTPTPSPTTPTPSPTTPTPSPTTPTPSPTTPTPSPTTPTPSPTTPTPSPTTPTPSPSTPTPSPTTPTPSPTTPTPSPTTPTPSPTTPTPSPTTPTPSPTTPTPSPTTPSLTTPAPHCPTAAVELNGQSGTFQSPSFPRYPNNSDCTWLITVDPGQVIQVHFTDFVLQSSRDCRRDYLTLYDGPNAQSTNLGKFCGQTFQDITSTGNQMYIHFHSDAERVRRGFKAQYTAKSGGTSYPSDEGKGGKCYKPEVSSVQGDFIVGGRPSNPHSYPWLVSIFHDHPSYGERPFCGGAIISETEIMTAAHCIVYIDGSSLSNMTLFPSKYKVRVGVHKLYDNTNTAMRIHNVTKIVVHEDFQPVTFFSDIAIMTVEPAIQFRREALPLCLGKSLDVDRKCIIAGWGGTGVESASDVLMEVSVPILSDATCKAPDFLGKLLMPGMFCAGYETGGKDSCQGDSGGPLFCERSDGSYEALGVISWGIGCALQKKPGVYSNVPYFAEWIRANMA